MTSRQPQFRNGMLASELPDDVGWVKGQTSQTGGSTDACVELAALPDGQIAIRNSRHPAGPALLFSQEEIRALVTGARAGDFASLI